jgi:hypothetical protein
VSTNKAITAAGRLIDMKAPGNVLDIR